MQENKDGSQMELVCLPVTFHTLQGNCAAVHVEEESPMRSGSQEKGDETCLKFEQLWQSACNHMTTKRCLTQLQGGSVRIIGCHFGPLVRRRVEERWSASPTMGGYQVQLSPSPSNVISRI